LRAPCSTHSAEPRLPVRPYAGECALPLPSRPTMNPSKLVAGPNDTYRSDRFIVVPSPLLEHPMRLLRTPFATCARL
jgi:hypothetical protein